MIPFDTVSVTTEKQIEKVFEKSGPLSKQFDHYEQRRSQIEMAKRVMEALTRDNKIMIEAGTGTGKTFAYLIPALLSGKKVVLSTGTKNLQDQIFFKDLTVLRSLFPIPIKAVLMKGKENYLCQYRFANFSLNPLIFEREELDYINQINKWAKETSKGDKAELVGLPENISIWKEISISGNQCHGKMCTFYNDCYLTQLKKEMEEAHLIVVNHHLFFADLALKESSYGQILSDYDVVIFDEAHLIEEIASGYFGKHLSPFDLIELVNDARKELKTLQIKDKLVWENIEHLFTRTDEFFNLFKQTNSERRFRLPSFTENRYKTDTEATFLNSLKWLESSFLNLPQKTEGSFKISDRAIQVRGDAEFFLKQENPDYIYWGESRTSDPGEQNLFPKLILHATPLEIASRLQESLFGQKRGMIFTSATLTVENRFEYIKDKIGLSSDGDFQFQSPFDFFSRGLIYLPVGLPDPTTEQFAEAAAKEIVQILKLTRGRAFILCTSHKNKEYFYDYCRDKIDYLLLKQGEGQKRELLDIFKKEISSVLFATQSFWQGVDVQGESLSCVIIDKLPFASPSDPIVEARIHDLKKKNLNPFDKYQVPSAIILLKQGLGRLIRSSEDRGVLSILDPRLKTKAYGKRFLSSLPSCPVTTDRNVIQKFFSH